MPRRTTSKNVPTLGVRQCQAWAENPRIDPRTGKKIVHPERYEERCALFGITAKDRAQLARTVLKLSPEIPSVVRRREIKRISQLETQDLEDDVIQLAKKIRQGKDGTTRLLSLTREYEQKIQQLRSKYEADIVVLNNRINRLQKELKDAQTGQSADLKKQLENNKKELKNLKKELDECKKDLQVARTPQEKKQLSDEAKRYQEEIETLKKEREELKEKLNKKTAENTALSEKLDILKEQNKELKEETEKEKLDDLELQKSEMRSEIKGLEETIDQQEKKINQQENTIDELEQIIDERKESGDQVESRDLTTAFQLLNTVISADKIDQIPRGNMYLKVAHQVIHQIIFAEEETDEELMCMNKQLYQMFTYFNKKNKDFNGEKALMEWWKPVELPSDKLAYPFAFYGLADAFQSGGGMNWNCVAKMLDKLRSKYSQALGGSKTESEEKISDLMLNIVNTQYTSISGNLKSLKKEVDQIPL